MRVRLRIAVVLAALVVGGTGLALWSISEWKNALQASRVKSCQQTYQAFIEVFKPYFPAGKPEEVTRFMRTVSHLKKHCVQQTNP